MTRELIDWPDGGRFPLDPEPRTVKVFEPAYVRKLEDGRTLVLVNHAADGKTWAHPAVITRRLR